MTRPIEIAGAAVSADHYIGGRRVPSAETFAVFSPIDQRVLGHVASGLAEHVEDADRLKPERWSGEERDYRFNHLSNGTQDCPGGALVLLLGKAVLAQLLDRYSLVLQRPEFDNTASLPASFDFYDACFSVRPRSRP